VNFFYIQTGIFLDFLYIFTNLAGYQLFIVTWDEERSSEASMDRKGARSAPFRLLVRLNGQTPQVP
jgi:hypothetical protein